MVHRYVEPKDVNGFKGEFIVQSDGDWDIIDNKTFERLKKASDYIIGFFEDDISFRTKKDIEGSYESYKSNNSFCLSFRNWLRDREIIFIIVKD